MGLVLFHFLEYWLLKGLKMIKDLRHIHDQFGTPSCRSFLYAHFGSYDFLEPSEIPQTRNWGKPFLVDYIFWSGSK